jgi:hypothetical protein
LLIFRYRVFSEEKKKPINDGNSWEIPDTLEFQNVGFVYITAPQNITAIGCYGEAMKFS